MDIFVAAIGTLSGTGYATRIASMLRSYGAAGWQIDLLHARNEQEAPPPDEVLAVIREYMPVMIPAPAPRDHFAVLPPLARVVTAHLPPGLAERAYDSAQGESSAVWPAVTRVRALRRVLVLHDDDSTRYTRIARQVRDPRRKLLRHAAAAKYARFQRRAIQTADQVWFVSQAELARMGDCAGKALLVPNGADAAFFAVPADAGRAGRTVMFVGPATYDANARAIEQFVAGVWPHVHRLAPDAELHLVGRGWAATAAATPGVVDRGFVDDLAATVASATVVVAPLLDGGGTKIKVLEAMAAARPVVATSVAAEGIPVSPGLRVEDDDRAAAAVIVSLLGDAELAHRAGTANRAAVENQEWSAIWARSIGELERVQRAKPR